MQALRESLLGTRAAHLASGHHSWPTVEHIQGPGSVLGEVGARGARPACALLEAGVARQGRSMQWAEVGEPETQAAIWMAAEVVGDPEKTAPTESRGAPGWGGPCPNHRC